MRKHINMSYIKIFSLILSSFFEVLFFIALIITFIVNSKIEYKIAFSIFICSLLIFHFAIIEFLSCIFSRIGKNKIIISNDIIRTKSSKIIIDNNVRIIYSRISLENFLNACPGELVVISSGKEIKLGWYTKREIKRIKKFIPNIEYESRLYLK